MLQEKITTTNYGTESQQEKFTYSIVMNAVQSFFAAVLGYCYTVFTRKSSSDKPIFPSTAILGPLVLVASTSSLSSPFGYASLAYVDYITFILAKSCKLLPVMFLHVTLYRRKYPFYKYAVVALVTVGVAIFTLHQPSGGKKKGSQSGNSAYGLTLLGINLLLDGLTNSTQDDINAKFKPFSGQQMMCALNVMQTLLMAAFLLLAPYIAQSPLGAYVDIPIQLEPALEFMQKHPAVVYDILGFAAAGAIGQLFICKSHHINGPMVQRTNADISRSLHPLSLRLALPRHGHSHEEDADYDPISRLVRPQIDAYAVGRRRLRVRWYHC